MNLRQMEVFHVLMRTSSMSEAARTLHITQPAVSQTLKQAEDQLGMKLFQRVRGRLQPTPEALALLPDVDEVFLRVKGIRRLANNLRNAQQGTVAVAATPTLVNTVLPLAVARFRETHPGVRFAIASQETPRVIDAVMQREVDIGIIYKTVGRPVETIDIYSGEVACVMHYDHPLAAQETVTAADLAGAALITYSESTPIGSSIAKSFARLGKEPDPAIIVGYSLTAYILANAGAGVALVDPSTLLAMKESYPNLTVRQFRPKTPIIIQLITSSSTPLSRISATFVEALKKEARVLF